MTTNNSLYANNASTQLIGTILNSSTTIPVTSTTGFPIVSASGDYFYITLDDGVNIEIVKVTGSTGTSFTGCVRGQEGTTARAFGTSITKVENRLTAGGIRRLARLSDRLMDVASIESIPIPSVVDGNSVLCASGDDNGVPLLGVVSGNKWKFLNYPGVVGSATVAAGFSSTSIPVAGANTIYPNGTAKTYLIQFTSGANIGVCRYAVIGGSTISWTPALSSSLSVGDTYEVYQGSYSGAVLRSGGIMTGPLQLAANAVSPMQAVPLQQLTEAISGGIPPGAVMAFAMATPPTGWLECNGSEVPRITYSSLFTAITTMYGAGNGTTTFNLPDFRGEFLRGWDHSKGSDPARGMGTSQTDAIQDITGSFAYRSVDTTGGAGEFPTSGAFAPNGPLVYEFGADLKASQSPSWTFDAARVVRTAAETRPRNIAVLYCIKF